MNNKKLVSILIVTYNAQKYINKTIKSCLSQTYPNFEILILDNASTDNTVKEIQKFKDKRIKLFKNNQNIGPYHGLNYLLDLSKGEYITIQDHDDLWLPQKLEKQVNYLNKHLSEIACGTKTFIFYENKNILISDKKPKKVNYVNHVSLLFRNQGYRYNPNFLLTDEHFEKITLKGNTNKIPCIQNTLTIHRIRKDHQNLSRIRFKFNIKNIKEYFYLNRISYKSLIGLTGIFVAKFFKPSIRWFIISKIVKRKSLIITKDDLNKKYPNIL